ncbi:MAG TPA: metallophosphoesterase, partial [Porphyromonadaceae bacterium]|nr:metallophosphoesterase [Porphyromonadaceae bacterium]
TIKTKIGVISDLHYTHPSLIVEKGAALENYLSNDRKLLVESEAILKETVANLLEENV